MSEPVLKTNVEAIKVEVKALLTEGTELFKQMNDVSKWDSFSEVISNIGVLSSFSLKLILAVEVATCNINEDLPGLKSGDKLDAAAELLDESIQLPFYLEPFDEYAFKMILSSSVSFLNKQFGNEWDLDKVEEALKTGENWVGMLKK